MKRLFRYCCMALASIAAFVSCDKDYYEDKYVSDAPKTELIEFLEGDWEVIYQHAWGYDINYTVIDGIVDLDSGYYIKETGEDNGPISRSSIDYFAFRFEDGFFTLLDANDSDYAWMIGLPLPYYITDGNKLYDDGHMFAGDIAQHVTVEKVSRNKMRMRVDDVGIGREYNCDHDGVIFKHKGSCELNEYWEGHWHQLLTFRRIDRFTVVNPPEGWMTYVDDSALLTQLSIPGSHASATYYGLYNDLASVTQRVKLEGQWDSGLRAFDFTVASDGGLSFKGNALERSFRDMVEVLQEKLMICKQDAAIVFVRPEDGVSESQLQQWRDYVGDVISDLDDAAAIWTPMMTMRQSRGRIIFVLDEEFTWKGKKDQMPGVKAVREGNTVSLTSMAGGESEKMYVQDVSGVSHADKLSAIFESMKLSMTFDNKEVEENVWMINSLSSFDGGYVEGAVRVAPTVWSFLSGEDVSEMVSGIAWDPSWKKSEEGPLGIVFMDFAAEESDELSFATLTEMIRLNNWNYVMKKR